MPIWRNGKYASDGGNASITAQAGWQIAQKLACFWGSVGFSRTWGRQGSHRTVHFFRQSSAALGTPRVEYQARTQGQLWLSFSAVNDMKFVAP